MTRRTLLSMVAVCPLSALRPPEAGWRQVTLSVGLGGRHLCPFQNGYLPARDIDRQTITLIDRDGNVAASFRLALPDAAVLGVFHVTVSADRTVAAAVEARAADGRYANLLVFCDFSGAVRRVVRTSPFGAVRPLFLPDGRLVCVGREIDERFEEIEGYHVLRFYSPDGRLLGKAAPIGLLRPRRGDPEPIEWEMAAGDGRIGMLDASTLRYVEFDGRGELVRPLAPLSIDPPATATGLALLSGGRCLISAEEQNAKSVEGRSKLYLLRVDATGGRASLVTGIASPQGSFGFSVLGVDSNEVVLRAHDRPRSLLFVPERVFLEART